MRGLSSLRQTLMGGLERNPLVRLLNPQGNTKEEEDWLKYGSSGPGRGLTGEYYGPGYMDLTSMPRGRVGGGNAGASTNWPANLVGPGSVTSITRGNVPGTITPDRTQSDQYRAAMGQQQPSFPATEQGQFQRYFQTGEMNPYFGTIAPGGPANAAAMAELARQKVAPGTTPGALSNYYRAESAMGRADMGDIISSMGYKGTPMEEWAKANPMLAFREYNKKFPGGQPAAAPAAQEPTFSGAGQGLDFNINPVAAPPGTQGVIPSRAVQAIQSAYTLPQADAPEKVNALLSKFGIAPGQNRTIIGN